MLKSKNFTFFIISIIHCVEISSYNLDTKNSVVFHDPLAGQYRKESYFGYSVALYANLNDPLVIVGAPRANVSRLIRIKEPGTVYYCRLNSLCREWPVDSSGNGKRREFNYINQVLDEGWLGASVSVENKAQPRVVVCAPKWKNIIQRNQFMNGICYYTFANSSSSFQKPAERLITSLVNPYRQTSVDINGVGYHYYGMGELGFSLHEFSDEPVWDIMIGSPGIYSWGGAPVLISVNQLEGLDEIVPADIRDAAYFGYSVTSGFYFDSSTRWYVSSAPRTFDMMGKILIFQYDKKNLKFMKSVMGTQVGEYFGASVTSCDVDGDARDEIIVGAPMWSDDGDEGRIYIISARKNSNGFDMTSIDGKFEDARFGSSVVCLGDLDHDGYEDVAVGAPWEENSGAVYIFNGGRQGLSAVPSQRIRGRDIGRLKGFGFAISEPRDIDGNGYPDVAVGAYRSGNAVLFRAHPAVDVRIQLSYVDSARLTSNTTAFSIKLCAFYDGYKVPYILRVIKKFKVDEAHHRAKLDKLEIINGTYQKDGVLHYRKSVCDDIPVILTRETKTDPIEISASLTVVNEESSGYFCNECVRINKERSRIEDTIRLPFDLDCGPDNVCYANLTSTVFTNLGNNNSYTIGGDKIIEIFVNIRNYGELAYQTQAHVFLPELIGLASINSDCIENPLVDGYSEVVCEVENPLRDQHTLSLELDMSQITSGSEVYAELINIPISLSTQSKNINPDGGIHNLSISLGVDADAVLSGKAEESAYSYLNTSEESKLEFIRFNHIYEVQKFGVTPIGQVSLTILVPTYLEDGEGEKIEISRINSTTLKSPNSNNRHNDDSCRIEKVFDNERMMIETGEDEIGDLAENSLRDRVLLLTCRNRKIHCMNITCILDVPKESGNSSAIAELKLTIDLQLKNFSDDLMDSKDIIHFVTNGTVVITHPVRQIRNDSRQGNAVLVGTKFLGTPVASPVAAWIIALSVLLGILLLAILIIVLIKLGFFNRKQKEELEALKAETDKKQGIVIETSSSTECLDRD